MQKASTMIYEHSDYRNYLHAVYLQKLAKNPRFSMRSFASQLGISHAALSKVFSGEKNLSGDRCLVISQKLGLNHKESEYFCLLAQLQRTKHPDARENIASKLKKFKPRNSIIDLELDQFRLLSEWYHFPILVLTKLKTFKNDPKWIAKKLGITASEAQLALDRLLRLKLLQEKDGALRWSQERVLVHSLEQKDEALSRYHEQVLQKTQQALKAFGPKEKITATETLPFSLQDIPKLRQLCDAFMDSLIEISQELKNPTEVFHVGLHLFPLTSIEKHKENQ